MNKKVSHKKKHIVFLTPGFPKNELDSTSIPALQVFLKNMRTALPYAKMTILTFQFPYTSHPFYWHNFKVIPLNGKNQRTKKLWVWQKALRTLKLLQKQKNIDVIHSFWIGECSMIGQRFAKRNNIKHIVTVMGQDAIIKNRYGNYIKPTITELVTLCLNHQQELYKTYQLKSTIIPWYLDTGAFPNLEKGTTDILGVGSLNKVKNYSKFIDVIAQLKNNIENLNVVLIGDGPQRAILQEKIISLDLEKTVTLTGRLPRENVLEHMARAKILLHTSAYESFGFVFLEALYSGLSIISKNTGMASPSKFWKISSTIEEFSEACKTFLASQPKKKRILLDSKDETIGLYLKLYNA